MHAEDLYKEFLEVTHIPKEMVAKAEKITSIGTRDETFAKGFEGMCISLTDVGPHDVAITYFHHPDLDFLNYLYQCINPNDMEHYRANFENLNMMNNRPVEDKTNG